MSKQPGTQAVMKQTLTVNLLWALEKGGEGGERRIQDTDGPCLLQTHGLAWDRALNNAGGMFSKE